MDLQPSARRRRRQREETQRAILDAAEELLLEDGHDRLSIRRLVSRCGYTAPTIYHYFSDKAGLVDALLEERFSKLLERLRRAPQHDDPVDKLRELALAVVRFGLRNPSHYRLLMTPRSDGREQPPAAEEVFALFVEPLEQLAEAGRLIAEAPEAAQQSVWAMIHGLIDLKSSRPDRSWSKSLVSVAVDALLRGLVRSSPGRRRRRSNDDE
jgi:AcrR family transcriptional regulator